MRGVAAVEGLPHRGDGGQGIGKEGVLREPAMGDAVMTARRRKGAKAERTAGGMCVKCLYCVTVKQIGRREFRWCALKDRRVVRPRWRKCYVKG